MATTTDATTGQDNPTMTEDDNKLEDLFAKVALLIRETPVTKELQTVSTADKLRLYGLYKHVTVGPCCDEEANGTATKPSVLAMEAHAKYTAWKACQDMMKPAAMLEYVEMAAAQPHWLGVQCRTMLEAYQGETVVDPTASLSSQTSNAATDGPSAGPDSSIEKEPLKESWFRQRLGWGSMEPRGQLDIGYDDLWFAMQQTLWIPRSSFAVYQSQEESIATTWRNATGRSAMVGLSARSLLDLYLLSKNYPKGSQIILAPGINVPGMLHVLRHHQLDIVSIDLPDNENDETIVGIHMDAVAQAISSRTVAILVTHPFGVICAGETTMRQLKALCLEHKLDLLEDCAECYTGLGEKCYKGSAHADVTLFSFGFIKTATALGGGVVLANQPDLISTMHRKQSSIYKDQTRIEYLRLVIAALLIRCLCDIPALYGLVYFCVSLIGWDFDRLVRHCVQGFPSTSSNQQTFGEFDVMMKKIRRRPSCAMMSVLRRRFQSAMKQVPSVKWRIEQCTSFRSKLQHSSLVKFAHDATLTHWLFPINVDAPKLLCSYACRHGYDITQGSSQLICTGGDEDCPKASALLSQVAYLPLSSRKLTKLNAFRLQKIINVVSTDLRKTEGTQTNSNIGPWKICIFVGVLAVIWRVSISSAAALLLRTTFAIGVLVGLLLTLFYWIQVSMSKFYLKTSNAFVRHLDVFQSRNNARLRPGVNPDLPDSDNDIFGHRVLDIPEVASQCKRAVVLTGSTGFIGRAILRDLLFHRKILGIMKVWLICRPKRGKSSYQRIADVLNDEMFSFLTEQEKEYLVVTIEGDVTSENAGIETESLDSLLSDKTVSHLIHCAAAVSFTQNMEDAGRANITASLFMQQLAGRFSGRIKFVHISTAFVHGGESGTSENPLDESLFPLGTFGAKEIYRSMLGTQFYAASAMRYLRFPNTYTFSKCVCEHLLMESSVPTIIVRPSIVGPALQVPFEGWAGKSPSTLVAAACLYFFYQWNLWYFGSHAVPCIPVDVLSRFILNKAFRRCLDPVAEDEPSSSDDDFERISVPEVSSMTTESDKSSMSARSEKHICNAAWDISSAAHTQFTWVEYAVAVTQVGAVMGNFSRLVAKIGLMFTTRLLPAMSLTLPQYEKLHWLLVVCPFQIILRLATATGSKTHGMKQLQAFLDLPLLFFPFMTKEYCFKSDLVAPQSMQGDRYLFLCTFAAHRFVQRASKGDKTSKGASSLAMYQLAGRLHSPTTTDAVWALSQPNGTLGIRWIAWAVVQIFSLIFDEVTVNIESFAAALKDHDGDAHIVLAPTHRSFCDFVLVSLFLFSIPELKIDIPHIAAAAEFAELPLVGWIVKICRALFIRRNQGFKDPALGRSIRLVLQNGASPVFEVFLEGGRSRDRRFVKPKTGFLKCLQNECKGSLLVIPVAINYECIPEQSSLAREASSFRSLPMSLGAFLSWLLKSFRGEIFLGRAHVTACSPLVVSKKSTKNFLELSNDIQRHQMKEVLVSQYHIECGAVALGLEAGLLEATLISLGCNTWSDQERTRMPPVPQDSSELWSVFLQCSHALAPLVYTQRPQWGEWLCHAVSGMPKILAEGTNEVIDELIHAFDTADACVKESIRHLKDNGFQCPTQEHVLEIAQQVSDTVPVLLLRAAVSFISLAEADTEAEIGISILQSKRLVGTPLHSKERLGFWGHADSSFVVSLDRRGSPRVSMKGGRYRPTTDYISGLVGFIEAETAIKVDPLHEAFRQGKSLDTGTGFTAKIDPQLLQQTVEKFSVATEERLRHGTGHSIEDVFLIRNGDDFRIPDVVVWPQSEGEVEAIVNLSVSQNWCIIPFGGGTNVSNATRCPPLALEPRPIVSVDLTLLNRVLWVDHENMVAQVQAGIRGGDLVREMKRQGYTIGHEPDSIEFSTLGGWIGTKASGMKRSKYGNIEDIVKAINVVTPKGCLSCGGIDQDIWGRTSTGMELSSLLLGSEGCLGIVTSAVIKIWPLPDIQDYDGILFPDFATGMRFVQDVAKMDGQKPASCRLLDNEHFRLGLALQSDPKSTFHKAISIVKKLFLKQVGFKPEHCACVTITYEGSKEQVQIQKRTIQRLSKKFGGLSVGSQSGKNGYDLTFLIAYLRDFALTYHMMGESFETFAPWSKAHSIVEQVKQCIQAEHKRKYLPGKPFVGCRVTQLYEQGACLYFYLCMSFDGVPDPLGSFLEIEGLARRVILQNGGSLSHHHGVGKIRAAFLPSINSPAFQEVQKKIKEGLDPLNIFGARNGAFAMKEANDESRKV